MDNKLFLTLFADLTNRFVGYVPKLVAGIFLLLIGLVLGSFLKRVVIQVSIALRLDRFLTKFRWGKPFSKADVRYGLYNFLGNLFFLVILLVFIDMAFIAWDLKFLSDLVGKAIFLFPRLAAAGIILGIGWFAALGASTALMKVLLRENIQRAPAIALYARIVLIVFFSSMALVELDIASGIVTIGFTAIVITLGLIAVLLVAMHGKSLFDRQMRQDGEQKDANGD